MSKQIPDTGGVGKMPGWAGGKVPTDDKGRPISGEALRRYRVRQAMARGEQITGPADMAEAARQRAAEALAMSQVTRENIEAAERIAANMNRQREAQAAMERERDRERRGQPIARQVSSSSGGDPYARDLDHDPEVVNLIVSGAPMAAINAKKAQIRAARDQDRASRERHRAEVGIHGGGAAMWETPQLVRETDPESGRPTGRLVPQWGPNGVVTGDPLMDGTRARPQEQVSIVHAGVPELGTDAVLGGPSTRHFEPQRSGYVPDPQRQPGGYWSATPAGPTLAHAEGSES